MVLFGNRNVPRWSIFLIDLFLSMFSVFLAYNLRFDFTIPEKEMAYFYLDLPIALVIRAGGFIIFKTYAGVIRYTSSEDAKRIFVTLLLGSILFSFLNIASFTITSRYVFPFSIIIIDFILLIFFMTSFRLFIKVLYQEFSTVSKEKNLVIIYGAGEAGLITKRTLERDQEINYKVEAFVDDNPSMSKLKLEGVTIYQTDKKLESLLQNHPIDALIISIQDVPVDRKQAIVETCLKHKVRVLNIPPTSKWINGELSFRQLKRIKIEDLLQRQAIELDKKSIKREIVGKVVLITGAAGSIGSEIARQLIEFKPKKIILLDIAETPLYELEIEFANKFKFTDHEVVVGDVRNEQRMRNVFRTFLPNVVYHAAAYKHVPLMENNPSESILANILGTKVCAKLAVEFDVSKFVLVSSDKAVNPTNVMGASKRIAEIFVQSLDYKIRNDKKTPCRFITTRFGNVLGSNGSVIPFFRKQIKAGGPITVTHPDVTRFFMTIPEACQLVLEAGSMGKGGEIFIFDMGKSVKIVDLAKKMVKLSGLELGKDIQLVFTGLRPGEKLYEELLNNEENTQSTHHPKIMIAKVREYTFEQIDTDITELVDSFDSQDNFQIVGKMKQMVPEFISKNSIFEKLDVEQVGMSDV